MPSFSVPITDHRGRRFELWSAASVRLPEPDSIQRERGRAARRIVWSHIDPLGRRKIRNLLICASLVLIGYSMAIVTNPTRNRTWPIVHVCVFGLLAFLTYKEVVALAATSICGGLLKRLICPSCGYHLRGLTPDPDHCTTCPECGAAWKLP